MISIEVGKKYIHLGTGEVVEVKRDDGNGLYSVVDENGKYMPVYAHQLSEIPE